MVSRYLNRRLRAMLTLGFATGLPYALIRDPLKAWLTERHFSIIAVGGLSWLALPASIKFLWAPLMDRFVPPWLGRRRGWLLFMQLSLAITTVVMGMAGTVAPLWGVLTIGLALAVFTASQDIAADAYRTDILRPADCGIGISLWVNAYRIAVVIAGAGLPYLVGQYAFSWSTCYEAFGGLIAFGAIATLIAPPEPPPAELPVSLRQAVIEPLTELLLRDRGWMILLFVFLFKIPELLVASQTMRFMLDVGIPIANVAAVKTGLGTAMSIAGVLTGGVVIARLGLRNSLWLCGGLGAVSNLGFCSLARSGPAHHLMVSAVCVENFCAGMVVATLVTFCTAQCNREFSATQYALLAGLAGLSESLLGTPAAAFAQHFGWSAFFIASVFAGVPGLLLLLRMPRQIHGTVFTL